MQLDDVVAHYLKHCTPLKPTLQNLQRLLSHIDLTSLNDDDTNDSIAQFSEKAVTDLGHVAAVCVYPTFVRMMANQFVNTPVKVATVVNFPTGDMPTQHVLAEIASAIDDGASEIDVVFPYRQYLQGDRSDVQAFLSACKLACGEGILMKVILETGELGSLDVIADASIDALRAGADFIKTSTGKVAKGASLDAATVMLLSIKQLQSTLARPMGLKVSGGIQDVDQALAYLALAENVMGLAWVTSEHFRIGASRLVDDILARA